MPDVIHVSSVAGSPLLDSAGERLGRVDDVVVRIDDGALPPVVGLRARIGGREMFVPIAAWSSSVPTSSGPRRRS